MSGNGIKKVTNLPEMESLPMDRTGTDSGELTMDHEFVQSSLDDDWSDPEKIAKRIEWYAEKIRNCRGPNHGMQAINSLREWVDHAFPKENEKE